MTFSYVKLSHQLTLPKPRHWQRPADPAGTEQFLLDLVSKRCPFFNLIKEATLVLFRHGIETVRARRMERVPLPASPGCNPNAWRAALQAPSVK